MSETSDMSGEVDLSVWATVGWGGARVPVARARLSGAGPAGPAAGDGEDVVGGGVLDPTVGAVLQAVPGGHQIAGGLQDRTVGADQAAVAGDLDQAIAAVPG